LLSLPRRLAIAFDLAGAFSLLAIPIAVTGAISSLGLSSLHRAIALLSPLIAIRAIIAVSILGLCGDHSGAE
jgi:hypothetical protein